jgi:hypothetical protein
MRILLFALAAAVAITSLAVTAPPASAQNCQALWVERNSYYKRAGYCFRTQRAIAWFGNGGCYITNQGSVPLSRSERNRIAQIVALERRLGCSD